MDSRLLEASLGKRPCDLVLRNCSIIDVFSCDSFKSDIGIYGGVIARFGDLKGKREVDIKGRTVAPGFLMGMSI